MSPRPMKKQRKFHSFIQRMLGTGNSQANMPTQGADETPWAEETSERGTRRSEQSLDVYSVSGKKRTCDKRIGKGGEGEVRRLRSQPDALVKIYNHKILQDSARSERIRRKIRDMYRLPTLKDDPRFAWPQLDVLDSKGNWIGYGMRRVKGYQFQTLCQPQLVQERVPSWDRRHVVRVALNFIDVLSTLHQHGVLVGDINPANFLFDPHTCEVYCLDCDSYQVPDGNSAHLCEVTVAMHLAPEFLDVDLKTKPRTVESEIFSAAVLLFRILTLGLHPYSRTYGADPVANLRSGCCGLGTNAGFRLPRGPWYRIWSHLPYRVKSLFVETFRDGHRSPSARPPLAEWKAGLNAYLEQMENKGYHNTEFIPKNEKSWAYHGNGNISVAHK